MSARAAQKTVRQPERGRQTLETAGLDAPAVRVPGDAESVIAQTVNKAHIDPLIMGACAQPAFRQQDRGFAAFRHDPHPFAAPNPGATLRILQMEKFLAFRQLLEASLDDAESAMAQAEAAAAVLDQSSVGRLSRMDAMQQQALATEIRERLSSQQLKIRSALGRIAAGTYGLCCECETELELERLQGEPAAVFCADCAAEREAQRNGARKP